MCRPRGSQADVELAWKYTAKGISLSAVEPTELTRKAHNNISRTAG